MKYTKKYLILFLLLLTASFLNGQLNYKEGYIITNENDTVVGKINDGGSIRNYKLCLFKANGAEKAVKFLPGEIKSYQLNNDKRYSSMKVLSDESFDFVFVESLLEGKVNLFYDMKSSNTSYYIQRDDEDPKVLARKDLLIVQESDDGFEEQKNTGMKIDVFKDTLISVFNDYPDLHSQVRNVNYNIKSLINISRAYIEETCQGDDCIVYLKDLDKYRSRFGVFSGIKMSFISFDGYRDPLTESLFSTSAESSLITSVPIGIFYNIPLVLLNERLSFQVEMIISQMNYNQAFTDEENFVDLIEINSTTLDIPFSLKYQIQKSFVSPSVSVGRSAGFLLNSSVRYTNSDKLVLHNKQPRGWFFELGLDYKIKPKISLFTNLRFQPTKNLVVAPESQKVKYSFLIDDFDFDVKYKTNLFSVLVGIKF